ncbi:MAG: hypothetical protein M1828_006777 [Chrysothrix sp. TS-e1954]|nr:MAG: hypothetical protein M1828_006777 [Chrysothrix sp. TS-e1954]
MATSIPNVQEKIPADAAHCPSAQIHIAAPAWHVWQIHLDTKNYPAWNSWCPQVEATPPTSPSHSVGDEELQVGGNITLHVRMSEKGGLTKAACAITEITKPKADIGEGDASSANGACYRTRWGPSGGITWVLRADRNCEIQGGNASDECDFRTWEWQAGPVARLVKLLFGSTIQKGFESWTNDLKVYSETTWQQKQQRDASTV